MILIQYKILVQASLLNRTRSYLIQHNLFNLIQHKLVKLIRHKFHGEDLNLIQYRFQTLHNTSIMGMTLKVVLSTVELPVYFTKVNLPPLERHLLHHK